MFTYLYIEPKEIIVEQVKENKGNDMIAPDSYRAIKIKGKCCVEVRPQTYDDRWAGRFDPNQKYDIVIMLHTDYLGEEGKKRLEIKFEEGE